ncbi:MAG: fibronectin type III domain-containing protein, partial [Elusimicrobia bacterium]|nr:fibronectin type III domain-containing protein [Elusimicrobiota bacterium]
MDKFRRVFAVLIVFIFLGSGFKWLLGNSTTAPDDKVKAPGDTTGCTTSGCHSAATVTNNSADLAIAGLPNSYSPGTAYALTFSISNDVDGNNGFEVGISTGSSRVGGWSNAEAGTQISGNYWKHGPANPGPVTFFTVTWTAPTTKIGNITFYGAANKGGAAPNNGNIHFKNWAVPQDDFAPSAISNLTALQGSNSGEIRLNWTAPGHDGTTSNFAGSYVIKYSSIGIISSSNFDSPPASLFASALTISTSGIAQNAAVERLVTGLNPGARYWFAIKSTDTALNASVWNSSADVTSVNTLLSTTAFSLAPENVSFYGVAAGSVSVRWDLVSGRSYIPVLSTSSDFLGAQTSSVTAPLNQNTTSYPNLQPNAVYYFKVKVSTQGDGAYSSCISTYTLPKSPGTVRYDVFTTSISVLSSANGNPVGTTFMISTAVIISDVFSTSDSSQSTVQAGDHQSTLTISGLIPNTIYSLRMKAVGFNNLSSSITIISIFERTLSAPPTLTSFQMFTTSVSVVLGRNGNPAGTPLTISTGTGGDYNVSNSSAGIVAGDDTTLVISNLSTATAYSFQAATREVPILFFTNPTTQTITITASTSTIAAAPTVSGFQMFSTSISVTLGSNGNPVGTTIAISTGNGGNYNVANSSIGIVSGANTTLVISNLSTATAYAFQAGARDSTSGASTRSVSVTGSTSTLSVAPTVTSFQVFATSVSVVLGSNGNPAGVTIAISTGTGGHFDVSNSS